ncbi:MAG: hypothetical protein DRG33_03715 [Deltaproteobacteria bacterium]|nr:MAG: hypothetical protein DRG33_03715 [Deltaproteobacteria bacterium]
MEGRQYKGLSLPTVLLTGLVLGILGLLEPLGRFWYSFLDLGVDWKWLLALYVASGLAISMLASAASGPLLSLAKLARTRIAMVSYHFAAASALAGVLAVAPWLRHELGALGLWIPYWILFPGLLAVAGFLVVKATKYTVQPFLASLFAYPGGGIWTSRLSTVLFIVLLLAPLVAVKQRRAEAVLRGRPPREGLFTRPSEDAVQNAVLITIDGLRADHLGLYGYTRPTSPRIDSLAAHGVVFENCFSQSNQPELSLASLITSLHPASHGLRDWHGLATPLPDAVETLAECLRDAGLSTSAVFSSPHAKRRWGLLQGYDRGKDFSFGYLSLLPVRYALKLGLLPQPDRTPVLGLARATTLATAAVREIDRLAGKPFFLHVHFADARHPYYPPEPFASEFRTAGAAMGNPVDLWDRNWAVLRSLPEAAADLSKADLLRFVDLYDGCIRFIDSAIGEILDALEEKGIARQTMIVIAGTYGNEFMEHGNMFCKSQRLHDETLHVPLIIFDPRRESPKRVKHVVRLLDLTPFLLDVFEQPTHGPFQGSPIGFAHRRESGLWGAFSQSYEWISFRTRTHRFSRSLKGGEKVCLRVSEAPSSRLEPIPLEDETCHRIEEVLLETLTNSCIPPLGRPGSAPVKPVEEPLD